MHHCLKDFKHLIATSQFGIAILTMQSVVTPPLYAPPLKSTVCLCNEVS